MKFKEIIKAAALSQLNAGKSINAQKFAHAMIRKHRDEFFEWATIKAESIAVILLESLLRGMAKAPEQLEFDHRILDVYAKYPIDPVYGVPSEDGSVDYQLSIYIEGDRLGKVAEARRKAGSELIEEAVRIEAHVKYRRKIGVPDDLNLVQWVSLKP